MDEALKKLVDFIRSASPEVWRVAYRQVFLNAAENLAVAVICIYAARWLYVRRQKNLEDEGDCGDADIARVFMMIGIVACSVIAVFCGIDACDDLLNPTFQAIHQLRGLV